VATDPYEYDLAVSFAGAQRAYVERFVDACKQLGLRVFYDRDMAVTYWGRNFIYEFRSIYGGTAARFVLAFISAEYLTTPYPQDEYAAATEQAFRRAGQPYLLPVVVGDVTIPPELLNPAIGWLRADDHTPTQLADMTLRRLGDGKSEIPASGQKLTAAGAPATPPANMLGSTSSLGATSVSEPPPSRPGPARSPKQTPSPSNRTAPAPEPVTRSVGRVVPAPKPASPKVVARRATLRKELSRLEERVHVKWYLWFLVIPITWPGLIGIAGQNISGFEPAWVLHADYIGVPVFAGFIVLMLARDGLLQGKINRVSKELKNLG
jgi:hypothetical protein